MKLELLSEPSWPKYSSVSFFSLSTLSLSSLSLIPLSSNYYLSIIFLSFNSHLFLSLTKPIHMHWCAHLHLSRTNRVNYSWINYCFIKKNYMILGFRRGQTLIGKSVKAFWLSGSYCTRKSVFQFWRMLTYLMMVVGINNHSRFT